MNECKAGVLTEKTPGSGYTFCYEKDYLLSDNPAISVTLPKRNEPYEDKHMFPFFTNILPDTTIHLVEHSFLDDKMKRNYLRIVNERIARFKRQSE